MGPIDAFETSSEAFYWYLNVIFIRNIGCFIFPSTTIVVMLSSTRLARAEPGSTRGFYQLKGCLFLATVARRCLWGIVGFLC